MRVNGDQRMKASWPVRWSQYVALAIVLLMPLSIAGPAAAANLVNTQPIEDFIRQEMQAANIPGLAVGIVSGDTILYMSGFGTAGPGLGDVTPQTPFMLGSVSKSITGLAIMQLVEQGQINLDDPVTQALPWFSMQGMQPENPLLIRHLLNHTSGIPARAGHDSGIETGSSLADRLRQKSQIRLVHQPGQVFEYSSLNYDILGAIIEAVTGLSFETYITIRIFQPLEMNHSFASLEKAASGGMAVGYRPWFGFLEPARIKYADSALPSGYVVSSVEDMTHFLIAFLNQGRYHQQSVLSAEGIAAAQASIGDTAYGAGWFSASYYQWHTGELANFKAYICTIPSEKLGFIMLANTNDIGIKYLNPDSSALRRIPDGIRMMLMGGKPPAVPPLSARAMAWLVGLVVMLLAALLIAILIRAVHAGRAGQRSRWRVLTRIVLPLILASVILVAVPLTIQASWAALFVSVPDLTVSLLVLSTILLAISLTGFLRSIPISKRKKKGG